MIRLANEEKSSNYVKDKDESNSNVSGLRADGASKDAPGPSDSPGVPGAAGQGIGNLNQEGADSSQDGRETHEQLRALLDEKEAQLAEYLDTLRRVQAETENFRKRILKEQTQIIELATQTVILELLPVIDNLERALSSAEAGSEGEKLREGVELIYSQLKGILEKECVKVIDPVGEMFDPMEHEAVMQVEIDGYEENMVVEVLQKGYSLKDRLLRPAMVKVSR